MILIMLWFQYFNKNQVLNVQNQGRDIVDNRRFPILDHDYPLTIKFNQMQTLCAYSKYNLSYKIQHSNRQKCPEQTLPTASNNSHHAHELGSYWRLCMQCRLYTKSIFFANRGIREPFALANHSRKLTCPRIHLYLACANLLTRCISDRGIIFFSILSFLIP